MPRPCPRNEAHALRLGVEWRGPDGLTWIERRWGVRNTNPESRVNPTDSGDQGTEAGDRVESEVVAAGSAEVVVPGSSGIDSEGGGSDSGPGESPRRSTRSGRGVKRRREAVCDDEGEGSKVTTKTDSESVSAGRTCRFCKKVLSSSNYRREHEKTVHMGVKDYHCHWCNKGFGVKSNRDRHEKTVHIGVKDYHCHWCKKGFGEKGTRDKHEKIVHKGIKDFDCERCGKKFGRRAHLSKHMKSSACQ